MQLTNDQLDTLSKVFSNATADAWVPYETVGNGWALKSYDPDDDPGPLAQNLTFDNAVFIAMVKNFLPALLQEVREARSK